MRSVVGIADEKREAVLAGDGVVGEIERLVAVLRADGICAADSRNKPGEIRFEGRELGLPVPEVVADDERAQLRRIEKRVPGFAAKFELNGLKNRQPP